MKNRAVMFWLAVLFLFAGTFSILYATGIIGQRDERTVTSQGHSSESDDSAKNAKALVGHEVNAFQLFDQQGKPFGSSDLDGQIWIASVFFSTCPGFCPMQNQQLKQFQSEFGDAGLHCLSITCDPVTDTSSVLAKYASRFDANPEKWHFLTGDMKEITRVGHDIFQIAMGPQAHSERFFLVDREGKIRNSYLSTDALAMAKLRKALKEIFAEESATSETVVTPANATTEPVTDRVEPTPTEQ